MGSMIEAIGRRVSTRAYTGQPVEAALKREIAGWLEANAQGPFGGRVRFALLDFDELERQEVRSLGTYGIIRGARLFIVSAIVDTREARADLGYCLEKVILEAANAGLGTCWMGGTFRRSNFARRIGVGSDEIVPVATPIGYPREKKTAADRAIRRLAGSDHRKPWAELFFHSDLATPLAKEECGSYAPPLESLRLGPSASNMQPWRVARTADSGNEIYHLYLKRTKGYEQKFGGINLQDIDMGIAMCHFELSARELGLAGSWDRLSPPPCAGRADYIASWFAPSVG
jgi:nitroreductase